MRTAAPAFFEVAAQLIPVLLVAGLVQGRLDLPAEEPEVRGEHEAPESPPLGPSLRRVFLMAGVVAGETSALVAVAGRPTAVETGWVVSSLTLLGMIVVAPIVYREFEVIEQHHGRRWVRVVVAVLMALVSISPLVPVLAYVLS